MVLGPNFAVVLCVKLSQNSAFILHHVLHVSSFGCYKHTPVCVNTLGVTVLAVDPVASRDLDETGQVCIA